jgi:hypothetical protein
MKIIARGFAKLDGTVFVITDSSKRTMSGEQYAQGVFKGQAAAKKFAARVGASAEIRVGHFINDTTIETI